MYQLIDKFIESAKEMDDDIFPFMANKKEFVEGKKNEELTMVSHPNEANKMVFIRILEDVGMHQLDDGTDEGDKIDLEKGKILFCKFQQFKGLLESSEEGGTPRAELL